MRYLHPPCITDFSAAIRIEDGSGPKGYVALLGLDSAAGLPNGKAREENAREDLWEGSKDPGVDPRKARD